MPRREIQPLAPSTVQKLRTQVRSARRPFALFIMRGPKGQLTRTEERWRCAERRGLAKVQRVMTGYLVTLTPHGEGYLHD